MIRHCFTVDVEEYFHASALAHAAPPSSWSRLPRRVDVGVDILLRLMADRGQQGTFFVLGWVAERYPELVRRIAEQGHEIGSHGWKHRLVSSLSPREFRRTVRRSRAVLEDVTGRRVQGYRAPSFSIGPGQEWALDVLLEEGYRYDSSIYPIRRPGYGYPGSGRDPFWILRPAGTILEVPPATLRTCGMTLPAGGGAYLRHLPYALIRTALRRCADRGVPGTVYIHPWEVDVDQPRLPVSGLTRLRHYGGIRHTERKLAQLLDEFRFQAVEGTLERMPPTRARVATASGRRTTLANPTESAAST